MVTRTRTFICLSVCLPACSGATNHWKNAAFRDFPTFSRTWIFFLRRLSLFDFLSYSLLFSDSSHLRFSSIHIVGSLTSKLPSTIFFAPSISKKRENIKRIRNKPCSQMVARCCKMHRSNATNHTNTITTPRPTRAKRARRARTARRTRRTRRTRTPTPTTAEQAGDILGNTNNPWGIAGVRSPTII